MAGNMMDLCADVFEKEGPPVTDRGRIPVPLALDEPRREWGRRTRRSGCWNLNPRDTQLGTRHMMEEGFRNYNLGFRLARLLV